MANATTPFHFVMIFYNFKLLSDLLNSGSGENEAYVESRGLYILENRKR